MQTQELRLSANRLFRQAKYFSRKWTPLYYAARDGNRELVEDIVEGGAPVDIKDEKGLSPLYFAACNGHYNIAIYLVKAGADCNIFNSCKWTPLFYAARDGHRELVETLVEAGAAVDLENDNRVSPLFIADTGAPFEMFIALVKAGAKPYRITEFELYFKFQELKKNKILIMYFLLFNSNSVKPDISLCPDEELIRFWNICTAQVEELKHTVLGNSKICFFRFLMENNDNKLVNYLSGDSVTEDVEKFLAIEKFSIYNEMIKKQFLKGQERKLLLQSVECLVPKSSLNLLPCEVRNMIFSYLSVSELVNLKKYLELIEVFGNDNVNAKRIRKCVEKRKVKKHKINCLV